MTEPAGSPESHKLPLGAPPAAPTPRWQRAGVGCASDLWELAH